MNLLRRMLGRLGGEVLLAGPVREAAPEPTEPTLMDDLKVQYEQTRKRVTHWALKVGAWKVGQIITLRYSRRQYQVFPDGSWRRLFNGVPRMAV